MQNWAPASMAGRANIERGSSEHRRGLPRWKHRTASAAHNGLLGQSDGGLPGRTGHGHGNGEGPEPKWNVVYSWTGDGVTGNGTTATVDTATLTPGTHTVKCNAKEGKPGKEGLKPWQVAAECSATFTVKEFEPPTISCSANPSTIKPGDTSHDHGYRRQPAEPSADLHLLRQRPAL